MTTTHKTSRMALAVLAGMLAAGTMPATAQVQVLPPDQMNYQGVLRDQNGNPLTGTYDMVFRFMDAATGGNEILVDSHTAANSNAVIVAGGLFDVALGTGTMSDGSGPGAYTVLRTVFRDYTDVWLEIEVGTETLSPRTRIQSAPYAFNAAYLRGRTGGEFLDMSSTYQTKSGQLRLDTSGGLGIFAELGGTAAPGVFNGNPLGIFVSGGAGTGIRSSGTNYGGEFSAPTANPNSVGVYVDHAGKYGVEATGSTAGGFFRGNGSATAALGAPNIGVDAFGPTGGRFAGLFGGTATLGTTVGGQFTNGTAGVEATLADGQVGIRASGNNIGAGGRFTNGTAGVEATLAEGQVGIRASGNNVGGEFTNGSSYAQAPYADRGIHAVGSWIGGSFKNNAYSATEALVAVGDVGIQAGGPSYGGYLYNGSPNFSYAYIPNVDRGITAYGSVVGGDFHNFSSGSWGYVGYSSYKILGSGAVSFAQNHPQDPSKVIVYAAPEGDEVAVYTRGSGRLVNGEARVALGGTFALVSNPDIGLTATATPRGDEPVPLVVSKLSPSEIVVRGPAGSDADFDFMVWGLRIGFEEQSIVQPKQEEAKIPSMHMHAQYFEDDPSLRDHTALARFQGIEESVRGRRQLDFSQAEQLRAAIGVSPKGEPAPPADAPGPRRDVPAASQGPSAEGGPVLAEQDPFGTQEAAEADAAGASQAVASQAVAHGVDLFQAAERIEPGDVVSLATDAPGHVVRSAGPDDSLLIGCAQPTETDPGTVAVASSRIALCRVDASHGPISIGDRLVASASPGMAMKMDPGTAGAHVLGRALEPLEAGTALVRVLLGVK